MPQRLSRRWIRDTGESEIEPSSAVPVSGRSEMHGSTASVAQFTPEEYSGRRIGVAAIGLM